MSVSSRAGRSRRDGRASAASTTRRRCPRSRRRCCRSSARATGCVRRATPPGSQATCRARRRSASSAAMFGDALDPDHFELFTRTELRPLWLDLVERMRLITRDHVAGPGGGGGGASKLTNAAILFSVASSTWSRPARVVARLVEVGDDEVRTDHRQDQHVALELEHREDHVGPAQVELRDQAAERDHDQHRRDDHHADVVAPDLLDLDRAPPPRTAASRAGSPHARARSAPRPRRGCRR